MNIRSAIICMVTCFVFSIICGFIFIPLLKKLKINQNLSVYLEVRHKDKNHTPTMGGFIFIVPPIITSLILLMLNKINISYHFIILLFTFLSYGLIGFIDDFLIIKKNNNKGLSEKQKILLQIIVATIFFYLFMKAGNEPLIWIHTLGIKWHIGFFYGLFILFILVASSNAVNLTDGLDGLAGGLSFISFIAFGIIAFKTGWLDGYKEIALFCFMLSGSLLGFLVFNAHPAKVFMGDTGSLALGASLGCVAILTRHELLLTVVGIMFVIETISCLIQRFYYKLTKKRIFPMTPIHHSFEKWGWMEKDIIRLFWIVGFIGASIAVIFGVYL